jgi:hypothetical protein
MQANVTCMQATICGGGQQVRAVYKKNRHAGYIKCAYKMMEWDELIYVHLIL